MLIVTDKFSHLEFSLFPCSSHSEAAMLGSLAALLSLLPGLVYETSSVKPIPYADLLEILLVCDTTTCSWIFDLCQDKTKICSTRSFKSNVSSASAQIIYVLAKIILVFYSCHEQQKILLWAF